MVTTTILTNKEFSSIWNNYPLLAPTGSLCVIFLNNKHLKV